MTAYNGQYEYEMIINLQPDFVSNRREVEVDMEKCKKGIWNIAQNQSFVQKGIGVKYIGIHSNALQPLYLHSFIA